MKTARIELNEKELDVLFSLVYEEVEKVITQLGHNNRNRLLIKKWKELSLLERKIRTAELKKEN